MIRVACLWCTVLKLVVDGLVGCILILHRYTILYQPVSPCEILWYVLAVKLLREACDTAGCVHQLVVAFNVRYLESIRSYANEF